MSLLWPDSELSLPYLPKAPFVCICYLQGSQLRVSPSALAFTIPTSFLPHQCPLPPACAYEQKTCSSSSLTSLSQYIFCSYKKRKKNPEAENYTQQDVYFVHCSGYGKARVGQIPLPSLLGALGCITV